MSLARTAIYIDRTVAPKAAFRDPEARHRERLILLDLLKRAVQRLLIHAVPFEGSDDPRLLSRRSSRSSGAPAPSGGNDLLQAAAAAVADVLARILSHGLRPRVGGEGSEDLWDLIQVRSQQSSDLIQWKQCSRSFSSTKRRICADMKHATIQPIHGLVWMSEVAVRESCCLTKARRCVLRRFQRRCPPAASCSPSSASASPT
jgi:hypothetical protein